MPVTQSDAFKQFKTDEYFKLVAESILRFRQATNSNTITKLLGDSILDYALTVKPEWLSSLEILGAHFNSLAVSKLTNSFFARYQNAFLAAVQQNYEEMLDLGIRHQIYDFLYQLPIMQKFFDKQAGNFSNFLANEVNFKKEDKRKAIEIKNTRRAGLTKRAVLNLLDRVRGIDVENLLTSENDFDAMGLTETERYAVNLREREAAYAALNKRYEAQINLKIADQTHEFVSSLNKIADFTKFAKASKKDFLADNYLKQRRRVLQTDFKSRTDENIRKSISSFLISNREDFVRVNSLRKKTDADIKLLRTRISYFIEKDMTEQRAYLPTKGVETVIRTELSIAYNFGKIAGFGSKADQYKRFRWVADRELAFVTNRIKKLDSTKDKIEDAPCEFCRIHDGLEYFLYEITNNGLKTGDILNYGSKTRGSKTVWRNWNNPQIPAHPSCHVAGTQVLIHNPIADVRYTKNIEDVVVGDLVVVPTAEQYKPVIQTHKNWYGEPLFKIRSSTGQTITLTGNHPIWDGTNWKDARDFVVGDYLYISSDEDKRVDAASLRIKFINRRHNKIECQVESFQQNCDFNYESNRYPQDNNRSVSNQKHTARTTEAQFSANDSKQPNDNAWCQTKDDRYYGIEKAGHANKFGCHVQRGTHQIQGGLSKGFGSPYKKLLGNKCCQNTTSSRYSIRVRANVQAVGRQIFSSRFLSAKLGHISRGQRSLVRGCQRKTRAVETTVQHQQFGNDSRERLQGFEAGFCRLSRVSVASIEVINEPQYVYNLSVADVPVYFANGILNHNCACHWVLVDDDLDIEDAKQKIAVQRPGGDARSSVKKFVTAAVVVAGAAAVAATIWKTGLGSAIGKALYKNFGQKSISPADIPRIVKEGLEGIKQYRLPETVLKQVNSSIIPELDRLGLPIRLDLLN